MSTEHVRIEQRGRGLWLRLNRPHALNALTAAMAEGLHHGLAMADQVRAVVIAGEGRTFWSPPSPTRARPGSRP